MSIPEFQEKIFAAITINLFLSSEPDRSIGDDDFIGAYRLFLIKNKGKINNAITLATEMLFEKETWG